MFFRPMGLWASSLSNFSHNTKERRRERARPAISTKCCYFSDSFLPLIIYWTDNYKLFYLLESIKLRKCRFIDKIIYILVEFLSKICLFGTSHRYTPTSFSKAESGCFFCYVLSLARFEKENMVDALCAENLNVLK